MIDTVSRNLASRCDVVVTETKPQVLKPGNICGGYGGLKPCPFKAKATTEADSLWE
jgi:hypothetical protein